MFQKKLIFEFEEDISRLRYLQVIFSFLVVLSLIEEFRLGFISWFLLVKFVLLVFGLKIYYKSIKNLLYTFWTLSFLFFIYLTYSLLMSFYILEISSLGLIYLLCLILMGIQVYALSSPVYYPRVRWWEYDFRYRHDLRVSIECEGINVEARLTDLRRAAGCVVSFEDFKIGSTMSVKYFSENQALLADAIIVSKREYAMGRGITYGVKFKFSNSEEKNKFMNFTSLWKKQQRKKTELKTSS